MKKLVLVCFLALPAMQTWAARPFVTDDARLTTAQSCQLESWVRVYSDSREAWALPACNPTGNLEFTVGGGWAKHDGEMATSDYVFQAKTLFRPLDANGWGWGLAVGTVRHPEISPGPNLLGNSYAYLPFSVSFNDDQVVLHANLGWLHDRATGEDNFTRGVGAEFQMFPRLMAIAEVFGDNHNATYWQAGGRFAIIPGRAQIDATIGQPFSGQTGGGWVSFGFRLTPESLF